jgi:hypothetical protein
VSGLAQFGLIEISAKGDFRISGKALRAS